jgi:hypothetical protein
MYLLLSFRSVAAMISAYFVAGWLEKSFKSYDLSPGIYFRVLLA